MWKLRKGPFFHLAFCGVQERRCGGAARGPSTMLIQGIGGALKKVRYIEIHRNLGESFQMGDSLEGDHRSGKMGVISRAERPQGTLGHTEL